MNWVETLPAIIPAQTMENAAEVVKNFSLKKWREKDGWHTHSAAIMPVTETFFNIVDAARKVDVLDFSADEPDQYFYFDSALDAEIIS